MAVTVALAGDAMLGRKVAERLSAEPAAPLVDDRIRDWLAGADLAIANLECCISDRGQRWPEPGKPFFFRAPPHAADRLAELGIDAVTLGNNHALDFGAVALSDTLEHLAAAGITAVGAGLDAAAARAPATWDLGAVRLALIGVTDHPEGFAASPARPGTAYAPLHREVPAWLESATARAGAAADITLVSPHWGPNMVRAPVAHVRAAAAALARSGATLIAGHSAHVPHGVAVHGATAICYDLGDFLDDYAVDPQLRNDLGFVWRVRFDGGDVQGIEALPIALEFCSTRVATGPDATWVRDRLARACAELGTVAEEHDGLVRVELG